jgi:hypothetical protein
VRAHAACACSTSAYPPEHLSGHGHAGLAEVGLAEVGLAEAGFAEAGLAEAGEGSAVIQPNVIL